MRNKALSVLEYHTRIESKLPLSVFGSTMDQSPVTHTVLRVSAMLSDSVIPVALFTVSSLKAVPVRFANVFAEMKGRFHCHRCRRWDKLTNEAFQDDHLDAALQYLLDHDFIQTPSSSSSESTDSNSASSPSTQSSISFDSFVMDSAARDHVRDSLTPEEKFDNAWLACNVCADGIEKNESASSTLQEIHEFARVMAPHAKTCYSDWSRVLEGPDDDVDGNEDVAWHILGRVCMTQGATEQAIGCFELSLQHASRLSAMERTQTALLLAILLQNNGQKQRSNEMLASIDLNLESIDKALGFRVALERAAFAAAQGEFDYAGDQYQSLEYLQEEELGASDMTTLGTAEALAATLARLHNYDVAMPLYRRVHLSYQKTLGESHPMTLHALESLARVCKDAFDIDGAEEMYAQSIEIKTRTLGAEHPGIANPLMCLGIIDDLRKRFSSARDRYQRALAIVAPSLGRAHPLYVATMENLALSRRLEAHDLPPPPPSPHVSHRRRRTFTHKRDGNDSSPSRSSLAPSADPSLLRLANDDDDDDDDGTTTTAARSAPAPAADASEGRISPRALAFNDAERLYFETIRIKQSARELYTQRDVFSTAAKLAEMYEHEEFYDADRRQRNGVLKDLLRESAGQRDMKKCLPMAVP